jgi:hypothetical protein
LFEKGLPNAGGNMIFIKLVQRRSAASFFMSLINWFTSVSSVPE